jgi:GNAT superfamily N-acetyltransferase
MLIRPIQLQDAAQIEKLYQQSASHLRDLGDHSDFLFDAVVYQKNGFGEDPAFAGIVAEIDNHLVGYLFYSFFFDTDQASKVMFILDLLVDQQHRQQGIGKALMQKAKTIAKTQGAKDLFWAVYQNNALAETFYTGLGAKKVSEVFFMTMPAEDELT